MFRVFFGEQCRLIPNDSFFPNNQIIESETRLSFFNIDTDTIIKLIHSLGPNKAQGCDEILMRMLKLCVTSISKHLLIIFNKSVMNECFTN